MFRKIALTAISAAVIGTAAMTATPNQAEARTTVHFGFNVGVPAPYYYGPGYYYAPAPVYYAPRYRWKCHRHKRRVRVWSPRRGRYVWRTIRGPRHCHRVRVW